MYKQSIPEDQIPVNLESVPADIRHLRQWVLWKLEPSAKKPKKVPYNARTGRYAASDDPQTWATLDDCLSAFRPEFAGIGFMFASGFCGIDLDDCVVDGQPAEWALKLVATFDSYTEISPSGSGLHIFTRATLPGKGLKRTLDGHKIEIYDTGRFFTFTGNKLAYTPEFCRESQSEVVGLYNTVRAATDSARKHNQKPKPFEFADSHIIETALNAKNGEKFERLWGGDTAGYETQSEADAALVQILCFYSQEDEQVARLWKASRLYRAKLERVDYVTVTILHARNYQTETYSGRLPEDLVADDDEPISADPVIESRVRVIWHDAALCKGAMTLMLTALGFGKLPMRLLNAIHFYMKDSLATRIITNDMLLRFYSNKAALMRDKAKLIHAQETVGVELIWNWRGRKNPATGEVFGSRYRSHIARWTLEAIALTIKAHGESFTGQQLRNTCESIAQKIAKSPRGCYMPEPMNQKVQAERAIAKAMKRLKSAWNAEGLTTGERLTELDRIYTEMLKLAGLSRNRL